MGQLSDDARAKILGLNCARFFGIDVPARYRHADADAMNNRTLRGKVGVVGVGETTYYKRGKSPDSEFKLALQAILAACEDAGIDPRRTSTASPPTATTATTRRASRRRSACQALRFSNMQWGGGGGGGSAPVGNAAAAIAAGKADCVVVFRALAQGQFGRFGAAPPGGSRRRGEHALNAPVRPDVAGTDASPCSASASCTTTASRRTRCAPSRWPPTTTRRTIRAP